MEPTFGERLSSWLKFVGMRPADLARALNVSRTAIHNWTSGAIDPGIARIAPICAALKVSPVEFFARMPTLEAKEPLPEEPEPPHPFTGEVTRELDMRAMERVQAGEACPTCGRHGEAA